MTELEFKYYILQNYKITYENLSMFSYCINIENLQITTSYVDVNNKIKPIISINNYENEDTKIYSTFTGALNYIKKNKDPNN